MIEYWINYWIAVVASLIGGFCLGYLWREKKLWDHKKGRHHAKK